MHRLKNMKETLVGCVQAQLADIKNVNTEELGQAIDMIKDLDEAMYYCSITKAMEKKEEEEKLMEKLRKENPQEYHHYYTERMIPYYPSEMYYPMERDMDRGMGRMYYSDRQPRNSRGEFTERYYSGDSSGNSGGSSGGSGRGGSSGGSSSGGSSGGSRGFYEREFPFDLRDEREGRSPRSRRMYMESKEMNKDKTQKVKELEKYMQELSEDIVEMIEDASPEEKQMLEKKMTHLTSKIAQLNQNG